MDNTSLYPLLYKLFSNVTIIISRNLALIIATMGGRVRGGGYPLHPPSHQHLHDFNYKPSGYSDERCPKYSPKAPSSPLGTIGYPLSLCRLLPPTCVSPLLPI